LVRQKDLEQSHVCLGVAAYPQQHDDRYVELVLNTVLGGSMSSRLFQNVREKRGLAYSVGSGVSSFRDTGVLSVYAGCANEKIGEVIQVIMAEIELLVGAAIDPSELQRAKDNVKGSLLLGLESTWNRAAYLARQEIYFNRPYSIDDTIDGIGRVTLEDVQRVSRALLSNVPFAVAVLGDVDGLMINPEQLLIRG
jgi:predicted Zn-dependent peptidase